MNAKKPDLLVYVTTKKSDDESHYTKVGAAWKHKTGEGYSIRLEALPITGELVLFPPKTEQI